MPGLNTIFVLKEQKCLLKGTSALAFFSRRNGPKTLNPPL